MARRGDAFEDRAQSQKPPNPRAGARNQGGFHNAPKPAVGPVAPPPVSRARKDSVLRPVSDGGSSAGGGIRGNRFAPPSPPAMRRGPTQDMGGGEVTIGPARHQQASETRDHGQGMIGPPQPRSRMGLNSFAPAPMPEPTPGSVPPEQAPTAKSEAMMPPSSPANAGARQPQSPAEMGAGMTDSGRPLPTPDAVPPASQPGSGIAPPGQAAGAFNQQVGEGGPDSFGGRMGEELIGMKVSGSDQIPNGREWRGEIGPGMPANDSGAVGIPGQRNTPEDVAVNRQRFDAALNQNKGDKLAASLSSGSFPSGNPIAHGTMSHIKRMAETSDGDGVNVAGLDESTRRRYKADTVRQFEEFGPYPGMDDPESPTPPVRPLSFTYNPLSGKWISPEGTESMIDRFGGGE